MHANRIQVLHRADGYHGVVGVAHHLELDLLESLYAFLDEHLMHRREVEGRAHEFAEFLFVVGEAASRASEGEGRTEYDGITNFRGDLRGMVDACGHIAGEHRLADALTELLAELAVLSPLDDLERGAENLHAAFLKHTLACELHCQVKACLSAESRHYRVGALEAHYLGHVFKCERLHIDFVGYLRISHDRGRVGVDEHYFITLFLEGGAGLGACIVEFGGLTNYDGA